MKLGIGFYSWGTIIVGAILALVGYLLWSNEVTSPGVLCIAIGAGFVLLGLMIIMTNMMMTMSVENIQNVKGKRGGPL
ncbi:MAG: hypothetical protein IKC93_06535 [Candidatus Methanomethylophilaceae archaeon]|nr:hypothetical protein [Candidatus Methanomethylophilaceae archaeon]